ncbi:unnamed protein product [Brugia timori]|uniref:Uncharacterized protein n=1 Tax=Brugia timori TaxID=42155 RepID=A0A0R3Q6F6_9BILA|nr:unnamed protein product [Brugia timori]
MNPVFLRLRNGRERCRMSLIIPEKFQHIHRVMNTNIDGNRKVPFAVNFIVDLFTSLFLA